MSNLASPSPREAEPDVRLFGLSLTYPELRGLDPRGDRDRTPFRSLAYATLDSLSANAYGMYLVHYAFVT
jgi:hypothetical protein